MTLRVMANFVDLVGRKSHVAARSEATKQPRCSNIEIAAAPAGPRDDGIGMEMLRS
jgi:hypothetical protein